MMMRIPNNGVLIIAAALFAAAAAAAGSLEDMAVLATTKQWRRLKVSKNNSPPPPPLPKRKTVKSTKKNPTRPTPVPAPTLATIKQCRTVGQTCIEKNNDCCTEYKWVGEYNWNTGCSAAIGICEFQPPTIQWPVIKTCKISGWTALRRAASTVHPSSWTLVWIVPSILIQRCIWLLHPQKKRQNPSPCLVSSTFFRNRDTPSSRKHYWPPVWLIILSVPGHGHGTDERCVRSLAWGFAQVFVCTTIRRNSARCFDVPCGRRRIPIIQLSVHRHVELGQYSHYHWGQWFSCDQWQVRRHTVRYSCHEWYRVRH